jgi:hypothetical protein
MKRSTLFIAFALIVNILGMFYVDRQGIPAVFASPVIFCLTWLAFNLLCFFIYMRLRPK